MTLVISKGKTQARKKEAGRGEFKPGQKKEKRRNLNLYIRVNSIRNQNRELLNQNLKTIRLYSLIREGKTEARKEKEQAVQASKKGKRESELTDSTKAERENL